MVKNDSMNNLVKILIGVAWLDGKIQPEERRYIHQLAEEKGVTADPEIQLLLNESRAVQPTECYEWVSQYLGESPTSTDCHNLLEAVSGLVYSDDEVEVEEANLLTRLESLNPTNGSPELGHNAVIKEIKKLYRRWVERQS